MNGRIEIKHHDGIVESNMVLPENSLIAQFLATFEGVVDCKLDLSAETVKDYECEQDTFITIATRTQGKRVDELYEVLLCLSAQTDRNFLFTIIGHNIGEREKDRVLEIIENQPSWLKRQTRFLTCEGGSRSKPLNIAFSYADTQYLTFLDDDDVVFDNWVEAFHESAKKNEGRILFSYVFTQDWEAIDSLYSDKALTAAGSPKPTYCEGYDYLKEVCNNYCPIMGLAYPVYVFKLFGLRFDEELTTTEDWDFLVRAASICGVANTEKPTSIYRLWKNAENSQSLHQKAEWDKNRMIIQEGLSKNPFLFPGEVTDAIIAKVDGGYGRIRFGGNHAMKLRYRSEDQAWNNGFELPTSSFFDPIDQMNYVEFSGLEILGVLSAFSLYLREESLLTLSDMHIKVETALGTTLDYGIFDVKSHGIIYKDTNTKMDKIAFLRPAPHVMINLEKNPVVLRSIKFSFAFENGVEERLLTGTKLVVRAKEKLRRIKRKLKKK